MSTFSEFSKNANHGDMNRMDSKKKTKSSDIAKNKIDPKTGNERDESIDRESAGRGYQENSNPNTSNRERSPDRNER
jgi:hypothetical protein